MQHVHYHTSCGAACDKHVFQSRMPSPVPQQSLFVRTAIEEHPTDKTQQTNQENTCPPRKLLQVQDAKASLLRNVMVRLLI